MRILQFGCDIGHLDGKVCQRLDVVGPRPRNPADHHVGVAADFDLLQPVLVHQCVEGAVQAVQEPHQIAGAVVLARSVKPTMSANRTEASSYLSAMTLSLGLFEPIGDAGRQHVGQQGLGALVLRFHDRLGARGIAQREPHRHDDHHAGGDGGDDEAHRLGPGRLQPGVARDQELQRDDQTGGDRRQSCRQDNVLDAQQQHHQTDPYQEEELSA